MRPLLWYVRSAGQQGEQKGWGEVGTLDSEASDRFRFVRERKLWHIQKSRQKPRNRDETSRTEISGIENEKLEYWVQNIYVVIFLNICMYYNWF